MSVIKLFLLGTVGYILAALYDISLIYEKKRFSRLLSIGYFIIAVPYLLLFWGWNTPHSPPLSTALIVLILLSAVLTLYTALLEIPLRNKGKGALYTEGTYALCRHPGFLAHALCNLMIGLYFFSLPTSLLCLLFVGCNLILVTLEDVLLFPRLFVHYDTYKLTTPFLIPRRRSERTR
jgi:protein-S-isoprenylcysteine O-methyltransferase Ste14